MDRKRFEALIEEKYGISADHPWTSTPNNTVFRHKGSKKWFALTMNIKKSLLGLEGEGSVDAVNLKCDFFLLCSLIEEDGFYPAYHMNKNHWITMLLDGSVDDAQAEKLLDISFTLTQNQKRAKNNFDF